MNDINSWWNALPSERFWLGCSGRVGEGEVLAAPCGPAHGPSLARHQLIRCIRDGDVVFHLDGAPAAIRAWSITRGPVRKRMLAWRGDRKGHDPGSAMSRRLPSWTIDLRCSVPLDRAVPLERIARIQSKLFPALREFEDRVGEPLYYPFAMGDPHATHVLAGYVFKLPSLVVLGCPELAGVAAQASWFSPT